MEIRHQIKFCQSFYDRLRKQMSQHVTHVCDFASVSWIIHFLSGRGANSIHRTDYLFKGRVGGREFSLHFIELKIIGFQASVNICESRRRLQDCFPSLCSCKHLKRVFHEEMAAPFVLSPFDTSLSCALGELN